MYSEETLLNCRLCPRLAAWREEVARVKRRAFRDWNYWGKPVPGFGDRLGRVLVVGLAPGAHGSNRTGRMFTGDDSGVFLYRALYDAGFASQPTSFEVGDGLRLTDMFITAVCRCVPPDNHPTNQEIANCRPYLVDDLLAMPHLQGCVALGRIAMDGLLAAWRSLGHNPPALPFGHGLVHEPGVGLPWLITSYHPSRQNTQTGRLTAGMFAGIWSLVRSRLAA